MTIFIIILAVIFIVTFFVRLFKNVNDDNYSAMNLQGENYTPLTHKTPTSPPKSIYYEPLPSSFPIDISKFIKTCSIGLYNIPAEYEYLAYDSVDTINIMLQQASNLVADFPLTILYASELSFTGNPEVREYTTLSYHPYTPTGKIAKYPYSVNFHNSESFNNYSYDSDGILIMQSGNCLFGTVYHLVDGRIGKIRITRWCNHNGYTINCGIKKDALQVIKIEKHIDGVAKVLYNYNAK